MKASKIKIYLDHNPHEFELAHIRSVTSQLAQSLCLVGVEDLEVKTFFKEENKFDFDEEVGETFEEQNYGLCDEDEDYAEDTWDE